MTDHVVHVRDVKPTCPHCGANLLIKESDIEPKPDDLVFCAEHGAIGTRETIRAKVLDEHRDEIAEHAKKHVEASLKTMLRKAGFRSR